MMLRRCPRRLLNVLCAFSLHPVSFIEKLIENIQGLYNVILNANVTFVQIKLQSFSLLYTIFFTWIICFHLTCFLF